MAMESASPPISSTVSVDTPFLEAHLRNMSAWTLFWFTPMRLPSKEVKSSALRPLSRCAETNTKYSSVPIGSMEYSMLFERPTV